MTVLLLEPVSFSGIAKSENLTSEGERKRTWRRKGFEKSAPEASARSVMAEECTLKTAQPDGKHLVKKPVAKR